jgi:hypothetical protein
LNGFVQPSVKALLNFVRALLEEGVTGAFEGVQNIHRKPGLHPGLEKQPGPSSDLDHRAFPARSSLNRQGHLPARLLGINVALIAFWSTPWNGTREPPSTAQFRLCVIDPGAGSGARFLRVLWHRKAGGEVTSMSSNVMQATAPILMAGSNPKCSAFADPANNHQDP